MPRTIHRFNYNSKILCVFAERTSFCSLLGKNTFHETSEQHRCATKWTPLTSSVFQSRKVVFRSWYYMYKYHLISYEKHWTRLARSNHVGTVSSPTSQHCPRTVDCSNQRWLLDLRLGQWPRLDVLFARLLQLFRQETKCPRRRAKDRCYAEWRWILLLRWSNLLHLSTDRRRSLSSGSSELAIQSFHEKKKSRWRCV